MQIFPSEASAFVWSDSALPVPSEPEPPLLRLLVIRECKRRKQHLRRGPAELVLPARITWSSAAERPAQADGWPRQWITNLGWKAAERCQSTCSTYRQKRRLPTNS